MPANAIPRKHTKFLLFIGENVIIHPYFYSFNSALIAYLPSVEVDKTLDILDFMERIFEGENNTENVHNIARDKLLSLSDEYFAISINERPYACLNRTRVE